MAAIRFPKNSGLSGKKTLMLKLKKLMKINRPQDNKNYGNPVLRMLLKNTQMRQMVPALFISVLAFISGCNNDDDIYFNASDTTGLDIILVIGQSNTHYGLGYDANRDAGEEGIWQLGRFGVNNYRIIAAAEPLEHYTMQKGYIGFALTFAHLYKLNFLEDKREILIIPCAMGGSGFMNDYWNPGDALFNDAVERTNYVLENYKGSRLVAILWHQGEADENNGNYQQQLDTMINHLRLSIVNNQEATPFILGGMVPFWTDKKESRKQINRIIEQTPERIPATGYADPRKPFVIEKPDNSLNEIHFDAEGQRELGQRYFAIYSDMVSAK